MDIKFIFLFCLLPALGVIFITWLLRFPWTWLFKAMITFEIIVAILIFVIELDARKTPGNSGWMMIFVAVFQIYFAVLLMIARWITWMVKKWR